MNGTPDAFDARDRVPGNIATTYLGERDGSERIGVRVGRDRYVILTRPAKGMNAETVGYKVVTSADPAEIHLDDGLSLFDARLIYAHEIGEHLAGNLSGTFLIPQLDWLYRRGERRAWLGAAGLLIPIALQRQFLTPDIAAVAMVPVWLAQMHRDALGL